ncbi:NAD(P)-dependent oxidoreductase [Thalassobaculum fulvum]|uniref:NAD(P)-dependent oxidoreductase n=1 Tax=Thalassobaculum fulvum TaxID=1633335 RepID=A0A919CSF4_9PROT|nr:SDR family NAD(P)-dependent oxidoreductase [Thalassobaculum fulvum]GHD57615.1 NAD(P)-dependent oxidoreductase [Thalassobaculum fulvum]
MPAMPEPTIAAGHAFFFGLGYTALRLARRLKAAGWRVSGTVRDVGKASALAAAEGIDVRVFDGSAPMAEGAFDGVTHVIDSIPPTAEGAPPLLHHAADLRACPSLRWVGYLSTPAVYGDRQGGWAREDEAPTPGSARGERRAAAERAWLAAFDGTSVTVQVFRIAGIYGPGQGRNPIDGLKAGKARIIEKPGQVFNRIHVDDIGTVLLASMARPRHGGIYNVADDEACPPGDPIRFAAELIGVEPPAPIGIDSAELSDMARSFYAECKRLDTARLRDELGVALSYPTYREGLRAIAAGAE